MFVKVLYECEGKQSIIFININQIVSIEYGEGGYYVDVSNGSCYYITNEEFNPIMNYMKKHNSLFNTAF